ncbi:hypothetical protein L6R53_09735 [Myxococcota bacterium]|nr:hypothetical protein [Myxococcota bacterium]
MIADSPVPRLDILRQLKDRLQRGSVVLHGPRRFGKSTLVGQLVQASPPSMSVLALDLEGMHRDPVDELARALRTELPRSTWARALDLGRRFDSLEAAGFGLSLKQGEVPAPWSRVEQLLRDAVAALGEKTLVVALDEVPWWLDAVRSTQGAPAARAALAQLRRLRQHPQLRSRLRMILTGSMGLSGLAGELGASAELNDLDVLEMPPMDPEEGRTLFEVELRADQRCDPEVAGYAVAMAGGSPHWIKLLAVECGEAPAPDVAAVDRAVDRLLQPALRHLFADEGMEHFRRRHPARLAVLQAMLSAVDGADRGVPRQAAFNAAVLTDPDLRQTDARDCLFLLYDAFLLREDGPEAVAWVNPIFRRWWRRYGVA